MPALEPVPGCIKVTSHHLLAGRDWSCSSYFSDGFALEYSVADVTAVAMAYQAAWDANMQTVLNGADEHVDVTATDLFNESAPEFVQPSGALGGQPGDALPINVAFRVKFVQDRRYRGGHSGIFIAGLGEGASTAAVDWPSATITAVVTGITDADAAVVALTSSHGQPYRHVAVSRFTGHAERGSPVMFQVTGVFGQSRICTRRKRL